MAEKVNVNKREPESRENEKGKYRMKCYSC